MTVLASRRHLAGPGKCRRDGGATKNGCHYILPSSVKRPNASERKLAANHRNDLKLTGPRPSGGKRRARLNAGKQARRARTWAEDLLERWLRRRAQGGEDQKKRVSIFDEQSHYVIENKDSALRTKPNKANFFGGKTVRRSRGLRLPRRAGDRLIRVGGERSALPMTRDPGRLPCPNKSARLQPGTTPRGARAGCPCYGEQLADITGRCPRQAAKLPSSAVLARRQKKTGGAEDANVPLQLRREHRRLLRELIDGVVRNGLPYLAE